MVPFLKVKQFISLLFCTIFHGDIPNQPTPWGNKSIFPNNIWWLCSSCKLLCDVSNCSWVWDNMTENKDPQKRKEHFWRIGGAPGPPKSRPGLKPKSKDGGWGILECFLDMKQNTPEDREGREIKTFGWIQVLSFMKNRSLFTVRLLNLVSKLTLRL